MNGETYRLKQSAEKIQEILDNAESGGTGDPGADGVTFTPSVSADGVISWTNDGDRENPDPVNIKGAKGDKGDPGSDATVTAENIIAALGYTPADANQVELPQGGSKEWLEANGDRDQLYQIDGYIWGYVVSDGWTRSSTQFIVVASESEMTNVGGTEYLLRSGNEGTVYRYTGASGDADTPVYDALPETANDGDIVAVGGRKYKASVTQTQVPEFTNLADPTSNEWLQNHRCSSSGVKEVEGMTVTNIVEMPAGSILRATGINLEAKIGTEEAAQEYQVIRGVLNSVSAIRNNPAYYTGKTGDVYTFENTDTKTCWYRFSGVVTNGDENVIITVNEEITYRTDTIVSWSDIGAYTPPVAAGWYATDEAYAVIDSLSGTASSGESAVYSADGYLYTYIVGAEWMQMGKYQTPPTVDDSLSLTSENPVQNKAVTAAIQAVQEIAEANQSGIEELTDRLDNIGDVGDGGEAVTIPSFWQEAVDECVTKIKALQDGKNCVTFPFFSDNHTRDGKTQYMGILIAHVMAECGIPYCFFGGDAITSAVASTADSNAEFREQAAAFKAAMSYIPDGRFCMALGNHEGYLKQNTSIEGSVTVNYDRDQTYDIFLRDEGAEQNKHYGGDGTYYYVDDLASKVRFIVLNTNGIENAEFDATQLTWLQDTALTFSESGWAAVIISHIPITNHYEQSNITNAAEVIAAVNASGVDIIGWYSGHIHRDRIYTGISVNDTDDTEGDALGFTQVTITSDHTAIAYPVGDSPTTHPIDDSDQSHAIDFVTVNRDTMTVNITRLGIGEDRSYTYAAAENPYEPVDTSGYLSEAQADEKYQPKGEYLTEHQKLKTINGQSLVGEGNIEIEGAGGGTAQAVNYDLNVKAINHRGYSAESPENTIPAYIMSKRKGFTYVECDVSFTSDGVAVLLHDATIDRTSNGTGNISSMTYEQALQYDFGSWFSAEYAGVKIPTFEEFLICCKRLGLHPYIELKSSGSYTQAQITQIVDEVEACGMTGKVTYISFNNTFLGYVKNADASARLGLCANPLNGTKINQIVALKTDTNEVFMDAKLSTVTTNLVNSCIEKGLPLEVWTVNTETEILGMPAYVSGVTSDNLIAGKVLYEAALSYVPPESTYVPATSITLDNSVITFSQFEAQTLVATVEPADTSDEVVWKSSDTSIATVENGVVTPKANGTCTITATAGSYSATCSVTVDVVMYTITRNLTGCKSSSSVTSVENNKSHTETITVLAGYKMDGAEIVVTMGGADITSNYVDGVLTIGAVTGDVVITITAVEVPAYNITRNLTGCTSTNTELKVNEGGALTETITALDGYKMDGATISVLMGGTDVSSAYDSTTSTISIAEVTGDIVITATAVELQMYTITRTLTNCTSNSDTASVTEDAPHTETITAASGYSLNGAEIVVTMGGTDISDKMVGGVLSIDAVTGDVVITVNAARSYEPIVDLTLANVTDGVLTNKGTGGSNYDATVTSGDYTSDADGLTLLTKAYASVPYGVKATDEFTIFFRGSIDEVNSNNYQRLMRTNQDMPSLFYRKSDACVCSKLAGKSGNGYAVHDDICTWSSSANCLTMPIDTIGLGTQHSYAWVGDGSKIYFYVDGVLTASQNSSPLTTSTSIGIGNNDKSNSYYANKLTVSAFKIYDYAMTAEKVALL